MLPFFSSIFDANLSANATISFAWKTQQQLTTSFRKASQRYSRGEKKGSKKN